MNAASTRPKSTVENTAAPPHNAMCTTATRHGIMKVLRWSATVGRRPSVAHRRALTVASVSSQVPTASALRTYTGRITAP